LISNLAVTVLLFSLTVYVYVCRTRLVRFDRGFFKTISWGVSFLATARVLNALPLLAGEQIHSPSILKASTIGEFLCYSVGAVLFISAAFRLRHRLNHSAQNRSDDYRWEVFQRAIPNILRPDGNLDGSVGTFLAYLRHGLGYEAISIHLLDDGGNSLKLCYSAGMDDNWQNLYRQLPIKDSLAGAVIDRGRVITVEELDTDPQLKKLLSSLRDIVSFFGCPLKFGEKSVGVFSIYGRKPRRFERIEVRTLVAAVDQLATILAFRELSAEISTKERKEALRQRLEEVALRHSELQTGLPVIATILKEYLPCDYLCVVLSDQTGQNMWRYTTSPGGSHLLEKGTIRPELGSILKLVFEGQAQLLSDCQPHLEELTTLPFTSELGSMLLAPLLPETVATIGNTPLKGALICASKQPGDFEEKSLEMLKLAATFTALVAQRDHLANDLKLKRKQSSRLADRIPFDSPVSSSSRAFREVAERIVTGLPTTSCGVMLFDSQSSSFKPLGSFHRQARGQEEMTLQPVPLRESPLLQRIMASRSAMTVKIGSADPLLDEKEQSKIFGADIKGGLILPVTSDRTVYGLLTVGERRNPLRQPFTDDDLEFCEGIANQLAPVLSRPLKEKVEETRLLEVVVESLPDLIFQMRSPLATILGNCELVSKVEGFATPEQAKRFARTVQNQAKKLHRCLETLSGLHSSMRAPRKQKIYNLEP
jgi:transcriptional regulator with GAF, ATPase, and Fis domain